MSANTWAVVKTDRGWWAVPIKTGRQIDSRIPARCDDWAEAYVWADAQARGVEVPC